MESILAKALEYTLKYWLKSFSRDQFKLEGHTVQLSNLDLNGDALHSSVGLPPALNVTTARVGKLEIMLPSVSNVQIEPIIVQIDRLDLVLEENSDFKPSESPTSSTTSSAPAKGSGYGFADKIADGMTIQIHTVNLLLETHGSSRRQGGATWAPPMASITIHNLLLYTTNESWQVVNLKEAREFSCNKKYIYVFNGSLNKLQSFDQKFENMNEALRLSCKKGYPVRVVRSHKEKRSSYAPDAGVRYDGVYRIEKCWRKNGRQGCKVCRYLFVRCDNEPAPWTSLTVFGLWVTNPLPETQ